MSSRPNLLCPYCGLPTRILVVHGHGQCERCGTNIEECCQGEQTQEAGPDPTVEED